MKNYTKREKVELISIMALSVLVVFTVMFFNSSKVVVGAGAVGYQTNPTFSIASSTSFSLTNTSTQILSSSTPTRRLAFTVQPTVCTSSNQIIYLNLNSSPTNAAATVGNGYAVFASSTAMFTDYGTAPFVIQSSVKAIANPGTTCSVLVTEWRSQY